jgi:hypothetical protein
MLSLPLRRGQVITPIRVSALHFLLALGWLLASHAHAEPTLTLARDDHWLIIRGGQLPGGEIRINYLEAYCRAGSSDADWVKHTKIPHETRDLSISDDGKVLKMTDVLEGAVEVRHTVTARNDEVDFRLVAENRTTKRSEAHWAQPCVRLAAFTGFDPNGPDLDDYIPKCFVFVGGKLARMPLPQWEKKARYMPGQVWGAPGVPRADLNPRPHSPVTLSNGLIGCFSADEKLIFATAWEPYQELFQGVGRCLHSDFRLGGLQPGERKEVRGKIYIVPADVPALLARYERDFPEHAAQHSR